METDSITNRILTTLDNEVIIFDIKKNKKLSIEHFREPIGNDILSWMKVDQNHQKLFFCDESGMIGVFNYQSNYYVLVLRCSI